MHFTRKNIVGKNMIFSIQNSNAKRQPMNMTNPNHSASPRLQFQYSKPNIRQNNHLMSNNMQYSVVKPKGQRLWSPVVHQKLKTRMYCNTVYECNLDYGTCSATTKGLQTYQDCSNTCHSTNLYTCDAIAAQCTLDPLGNLTKTSCDSDCFPHYDCCGNTGKCNMSGIRGPYTDKSVCDTSCANFGCDTSGTGTCKPGFGTQTLRDCSNATTTCEKHTYGCNLTTGDCIDGCGNLTETECQDRGGQVGGKCEITTYGCDTSGTGTCKPGFGTQTLRDCSNATTTCEKHTYGCNLTTGDCIDGSGTQTENVCLSNCYIHYSCDTKDTDASFTCKPDASGQPIEDCSKSCKKHYDCCGNTGTCIMTGLSGDYIDSSTCKASCEQDLYSCDTSNYKCKLQTDPLIFNEYKEDTCIAENLTAFDKYYDYDLAKCQTKTIASYHSNRGTGFFLSWRAPWTTYTTLGQCGIIRCTQETVACDIDALCDFVDILTTESLTKMKTFEVSTITTEKDLATCILKTDCGDWVGKGTCRIRNNTIDNDPSGDCSGNDVYYGMMNYEQCSKYCKSK